MPTSFVLSELHDGVLVLTLNRPDKMNASNALMEKELVRFFIDVVHDKDSRVIVLTGAGKAFSAGGDLAYISEMIEDPSQIWDGLVDGKRLPAGTPSTYATNLNQIPAALIKRVEVLTGGASSIYGSDAVAGVVNFIMNDSFEGVQAQWNPSFYQHNQHN